MKPTPFPRLASLVLNSKHPRKNPSWLILLIAIAITSSAFGLGHTRYIETVPSESGFPIVEGTLAAPISVDTQDHAGVVRATRDLEADVRRVTGRTPAVIHDPNGLTANVIIVGTPGKSALLGRLVQDGKLDVRSIQGRWESSLLQVFGIRCLELRTPWSSPAATSEEPFTRFTISLNRSSFRPGTAPRRIHPTVGGARVRPDPGARDRGDYLPAP